MKVTNYEAVELLNRNELLISLCSDVKTNHVDSRPKAAVHVTGGTSMRRKFPLFMAAFLCCLLSLTTLYAQCPPDDGNGAWHSSNELDGKRTTNENGQEVPVTTGGWRSVSPLGPSSVMYTFCFRCNAETGQLEFSISGVQVAPNPTYDQDQFGDNDMPHFTDMAQEALGSWILGGTDNMPDPDDPADAELPIYEMLLEAAGCGGSGGEIPTCESVEDGSATPQTVRIGKATCIGEIEAFDPFLGTMVRYAFPCQGSVGQCTRSYSVCWQWSGTAWDETHDNGDGTFGAMVPYREYVITETTEYDNTDCPDKCMVIGEDGQPHQATTTYRLCQ
jgi:hypothetical protein